MKDFLANGYRNPLEETRQDLIDAGAPLLAPAARHDQTRVNDEFASVNRRITQWKLAHPYADREDFPRRFRWRVGVFRWGSFGGRRWFGDDFGSLPQPPTVRMTQDLHAVRRQVWAELLQLPREQRVHQRRDVSRQPSLQDPVVKGDAFRAWRLHDGSQRGRSGSSAQCPGIETSSPQHRGFVVPAAALAICLQAALPDFGHRP